MACIDVMLPHAHANRENKILPCMLASTPSIQLDISADSRTPEIQFDTERL